MKQLSAYARAFALGFAGVMAITRQLDVQSVTAAFFSGILSALNLHRQSPAQLQAGPVGSSKVEN